MKRFLVLMASIGLLVGFSACGATVQQSVKATPQGVGNSGPSYYGEHSAYQHDEWIQDTPFGY